MDSCNPERGAGRSHLSRFSRRYRAALLDYMLRGGETELERAHELGRMAMDEGLGLLALLRTHQRAVENILAAAPDGDKNLRRLNASQAFLMDALSVFEMTHRGYVALVESPLGPAPAPRARRRSSARR